MASVLPRSVISNYGAKRMLPYEINNLAEDDPVPVWLLSGTLWAKTCISFIDGGRNYRAWTPAGAGKLWFR